MKILDNKKVINTIKSFRKINKSQNDSMRFEIVNTGMDKMEETDKVVGDGGSFKATTVSWVKEWLHNWH